MFPYRIFSCPLRGFLIDLFLCVSFLLTDLVLKCHYFKINWVFYCNLACVTPLITCRWRSLRFDIYKVIYSVDESKGVAHRVWLERHDWVAESVLPPPTSTLLICEVSFDSIHGSISSLFILRSLSVVAYRSICSSDRWPGLWFSPSLRASVSVFTIILDCSSGISFFCRCRHVQIQVSVTFAGRIVFLHRYRYRIGLSFLSL